MANQISAQLKAKLRKAREKFAKAEPAERNSTANRKVPDGTYTAKVVGLEFAEFGKNVVLRFTYEITDADKKSHEVAIGQMVESRFNLDTDEGPSYVKRDFASFGYDNVDDLLDDPDAANEIFEQLLSLNPVVKIAVNMDDTDTWQNVWLNDVLEMDDEATEEVAETEEEETEEEEEEVEEEEPPKKKGTSKGATKPPAKSNKGKVTGTKEEESTGSDDDEETETDEETEESSDEEGELEVGDIVEVNYKGKDVAATVVSIDEDNSTAKVQIDNKRVVVPLEKVFLLEG